MTTAKELPDWIIKACASNIVLHDAICEALNIPHSDLDNIIRVKYDDLQKIAFDYELVDLQDDLRKAMASVFVKYRPLLSKMTETQRNNLTQVYIGTALAAWARRYI